MPKAVRFAEYGDVDVLRVVEVERPVPGAGQVLVEVRAASINPGEAKIRAGLLHDRWPATFPSGEGSDVAGVVAEVGPGVTGFAPGDEVLGFTDRRASHAELVVVDAGDLAAKPAGLPWEVAGSLYVAGATAWAMVRAVAVRPGDTVVVAGAAGGVGSLAVQLARRAGATVIGLASERHHEWLRWHGVVPVTYGEGVAERILAVGKPDALLDAVGGGYVEIGLYELGITPERIDTVVDFAAPAKYGVKGEGNAEGGRIEVIAELAALASAGELEVPIAATYPLEQVREAYRALAGAHPRGKIVLIPTPATG
ncbi:NADP-dependent oxidoreductase [Cryptosporangium minutisporangium]|uniref:NADP-dependent oxidoreductase n=1 Tax=Cryptosporangium minutisporangium TaxID=113569 RepID=A0ABP6TDE5_9ACTN